MTNAWVRPNSTDRDKKLDAELLSLGGQDVYRLRFRNAGENLDAFQRLRVAAPYTQFDWMSQYAPATFANQLKWESAVVGSGSVAPVANQNSLRLTTGAVTDTHSCTIQTKKHFLYQPGKSRAVLMTFVMGAAQTNGNVELGYGSATDGIFLQRVGGSVQFCRRTNTTGVVVDNVVAQANWNQDTLDGRGPSGVSLDFTKTQILVIDLQYLGVGMVRFGFDVDGILIWAHWSKHANNLSTVYMASGSQPLRARVWNTGAAGGVTTLDFICATVISEGGYEGERANAFSTDNVITPKATGTTLVPILSIRPATTFNGVTFRGHVALSDFGVDGSVDHRVVLLRNATLTNAAFGAVNATYSAVERDVSATVVAGGVQVWSGYLGAAATRTVLSASLPQDDPLVYTSLGNVQETFTIAAQTLTGTSTALGVFNWQERY